MNAIEWLEHRVPGFPELPSEDRAAVYHFVLLWSLFEAKALGTNASSDAIIALVRQRQAQGRLNAAAFEPILNYFCGRYCPDGVFTHYFDGLHLRKSDNPALVREVLLRADSDPKDVVAAVLIVIYRFRNNLFHGIKWAYGIQGQRVNFEFANKALMAALEQFTE